MGFIRTSQGPTNLGREKTIHRYEGFDPKTYDYKRDAKFKVVLVQDAGKGPTEKAFTQEFKFLRNEQVTIGSCIFVSSLLEMTFTPYAAQTSMRSPTIVRYIPDLMVMLSVPSESQQLVVLEIATSFENLSFETK